MPEVKIAPFAKQAFKYKRIFLHGNDCWTLGQKGLPENSRNMVMAKDSNKTSWTDRK